MSILAFTASAAAASVHAAPHGLDALSGVTHSQVLLQPHVSDDVVRPRLHYTRPIGWIGDPIGFFDNETGLHHLFAVCNPNNTIAPWDPDAGNTWCHASADDLGGPWVTHPPALTREMANFSADRSGSPAVGRTGTVVELGTRDRKSLGARVAIVTAGAVLWTTNDPNLDSWKEVGGLNLPNVSQYELSPCGDVHVYKFKSVWRLVMGGARGEDACEKENSKPLAILYESHNLGLGEANAETAKSGWVFKSVLWEGPEDMGPKVEVPSIVMPKGPDSDLRVFFWSSPHHKNRGSYYAVGTEKEDGSLFVNRTSQLEYGQGYSAQAFASSFGRTVLFSWLQGEPFCSQWHGEECTDGYRGAISLPREVSLTDNGKVMLQPAPEVMSRVVLRQQKTKGLSLVAEAFGTQQVVPNQPPPDSPVWLHIAADIESYGPRNRSSFGIDLMGHIFQLIFDGRVVRDARGNVVEDDSSTLMRVDGEASAPVEHELADPMEVSHDQLEDRKARNDSWWFSWRTSIFVDRSVVEAYANNGTTVITATRVDRNYSYVFDGRPKAVDGTAEVWISNARAKVQLSWANLEGLLPDGAMQRDENGTIVDQLPTGGRASSAASRG